MRRLAVGVHALAGALARLAELRRHLQVLQVRQLQHQVLLHLGEELGEGALGHTPDDVFLLVEVEWLLAAAKLADLALLIILLLALYLALKIVLVLAPALILLVQFGTLSASTSLRAVRMNPLPTLVFLFQAVDIFWGQDRLALQVQSLLFVIAPARSLALFHDFLAPGAAPSAAEEFLHFGAEVFELLSLFHAKKLLAQVALVFFVGEVVCQLGDK